MFTTSLHSSPYLIAFRESTSRRNAPMVFSPHQYSPLSWVKLDQLHRRVGNSPGITLSYRVELSFCPDDGLYDLLRYCSTVAALLQHCYSTVAALLQHCCSTVTALLQHCCSTVAALLQHCCSTKAALLQHCCSTAQLAGYFHRVSADVHLELRIISYMSSKVHYDGKQLRDTGVYSLRRLPTTLPTLMGAEMHTCGTGWQPTAHADVIEHQKLIAPSSYKSTSLLW